MLREQTAVDGTSASGIVGDVSVNVGGPQVPSLIGEATKIRQRFRDAGYTPIPAEGKACRLPGWSKLVGEVLSDDFISSWEKKATWLNTGILCGAVRVIDKVLVWLRANASLPSCGCQEAFLQRIALFAVKAAISASRSSIRAAKAFLWASWLDWLTVLRAQ